MIGLTIIVDAKGKDLRFEGHPLHTDDATKQERWVLGILAQVVGESIGLISQHLQAGKPITYDHVSVEAGEVCKRELREYLARAARDS